MGAKDLYSTYIASCIFNAFSSYAAIVFNIVTHAIRKTNSLPKPLKTLLLSLAVSDLGVGLIVQPLYIACLVMELKQDTCTGNNPTFNTIPIAYGFKANLFAFASFFGVLALTADRFLAIHLHLRYQELVTHKRLVAVVISIWVSCAILSSVEAWRPENIVDVIEAIVATACVLTTIFLNYKRYVAVRQHTHQIDALQVQQVAQNGERANFGRLRKYAVVTIYVT